jgi:membrane-associated phospholipid phosphatase
MCSQFDLERYQMFFDPELTNVFRDLLPWAGSFFRAITELGSELFFVTIILIGYWAFWKREAILTAIVLLISVCTNFWLKVAIANPRPDASTYWYEGVSESNYSTPSGHSQNSASLFGWIGVRAKRWWTLIISAAIITLVGLSRIYLGLHYLGDVLLGWGLGILTVLILFFAEKPLTQFLSKYKDEYILGGLIVFGFAATLVTTVLVPPSTIPLGDNFGALGGLLVGFGLGLLLERKFVNFEVEPHNGERWRLVLRVVLGLILVIGIMVGLSPILVTTDLWLRMLRYILVAFVGTFVWPFIFKKANL